MRYCVQPATAKDVALLALAMGDEDAGDTEYDRDGEQKPLDHLLNAFQRPPGWVARECP